MEERNIFAQKKAPFKCPEIVTFLREENFSALEAELAKGWDINQEVRVLHREKHRRLQRHSGMLFLLKEGAWHVHLTL